MANDVSKDTVQEVAESAVHHLGRIATIVGTAVGDIVKELGDWVNEMADLRPVPEPAKAEEPPAAAATDEVPD
jgi:hypothetical protein